MEDENTPFRLMFTKSYVVDGVRSDYNGSREFRIYICLDGRVYLFPV